MLEPVPEAMPSSHPDSSEAVRVEVIMDRSGEAFAALRIEWQDLWNQADDATEAESWEWQSLYRRLVTPRQPCGIATARRGDGTCIAIATFSVDRDRRTGLQRVGFLGEHDADYHNILHAPGTPVSVGTQILEALTLEPALRAGRIELCNVLLDSWTDGAIVNFRRGVEGRGWPSRSLKGETYAVPLPSTMEEYEESFRARTSKSYRQFERMGRILRKDYRVEVRVCQTVKEVGDAFPAVRAIDAARWGAGSRYLRKAENEFHTALASAFAERGLYRLFLLTLDDRPAAFIAGFRIRDSFKVPTLAHDPQVAGRYSIGKVLSICAIEHCISEGCREYDLTRGGEQYKRWLGGELHATGGTWIYRSRWAQFVEGAAGRIVPRLARSPWVRRIGRLLRQW